MADPTTPAESTDNQEAPKKKAPERLAELETKLAQVSDAAAQSSARAEKAEAALADAASRTAALEGRVASLTEFLDAKLAPLLAKLDDGEDPLRAIDTTPAKHVGSIMLDDRMSETEILTRVRAIRAGKLAPDTATRFRTDARMWPDRGTRLAELHAGKTIPLRTEVARDDFTPESLEHHIGSGALIPIA